MTQMESSSNVTGSTKTSALVFISGTNSVKKLFVLKVGTSSNEQ